jgi:hypothetical protein
MDHWRRRPSTTAGFAILIADARVLANEVNVLGCELADKGISVIRCFNRWRSVDRPPPQHRQNLPLRRSICTLFAGRRPIA